MEPFDSIEKLISEHGSAAILRDHIALLKSQMAAKDAEIDTLTVENENLKVLLEQKNTQTNNLEKRGDACPYCQQPTGKLLDIRPARKFGRLGVKTYYYQCENKDCGKTYDRTPKLD
jgi:hypothetical protein